MVVGLSKISWNFGWKKIVFGLINYKEKEFGSQQLCINRMFRSNLCKKPNWNSQLEIVLSNDLILYFNIIKITETEFQQNVLFERFFKLLC